MIAGRRDRKRSLIRSRVMASAMAKNLSLKDGVSANKRGSSSDFGNAASASPFSMSASQPELTMYLRQLSTLHAVGILTDEEYLAVRGRLLGS
jgi:hypothetical protein